MEKSYLRRIYWQLTGVIMAGMLLALAGISYFTHREFERELLPEVAKKAASVGTSVSALLDKAQGYGIEYKLLYGVEQTFKEVVDRYPDYDYMAATDESGQIVFQYGNRPAGARAYFSTPEGMRPTTLTGGAPYSVVSNQYLVSLPLVREDKGQGALHIGVSQDFVGKIMLEVLLDIVVVLVVALFFTLELLNFIAGAPLASGLAAFAAAIERVKGGDFSQRIRAGDDEVGGVLRHVDGAIARLNDSYGALTEQLQSRLKNASDGTRARLQEVAGAWEALRTRFRFGGREAPAVEAEGALTRIRAPLFLFILAEELTRSFLPSYIQQLLVPIPGLSPQVVIGLPIILFMLIVAVGQPFLGSWSERVGRRRAMLAGAVIGILGFALTAIARDLIDLLAWRSMCAIGYAIVFVAAQGYVLDHSKPEKRAQGFALFIGAIMVATVCGPSIGGILADNIGYRPSFAISAVLCTLSVLAILTLPAAEAARALRPERAPTFADFSNLLVNARFMVLTALAAMPAKIMLTGVCFYLVPLYIVSIDSTQAMAGRMLMVYAVMMVLIVPLAARISDVGARREQLVAMGLCISGMGGLLMLTSASATVVFGVVFLLGLGQAISIAAQSALVGELCGDEIRRYGDGAVYGVYRMLERFGNALGPLIAALLVVQLGYPGAFVAMSILVLVCGILFGLTITLMIRRNPAPVAT